jgi:hypothetical protein
LTGSAKATCANDDWRMTPVHEDESDDRVKILAGNAVSMRHGSMATGMGQAWRMSCGGWNSRREEVVLLGEVFAEQLLDGGDQWSGRTSEVGGHGRRYSASQR